MLITDVIGEIKKVLTCIRIYKVFDQEYDKEKIAGMPAAFIDVGDIDLDPAFGIVKKDRTNQAEAVYWEKTEDMTLDVAVTIIDTNVEQTEQHVNNFRNNFELQFKDSLQFPIHANFVSIDNNEDATILGETWGMDINMEFEGINVWANKIKRLPVERPTTVLTEPQ